MTLRYRSSRPSLLLLGCAVASAAHPPPPYPSLRYSPWKDLPDDAQMSARAAGYHEKSWNKPGELNAEALDYESLSTEMVKFLESIPMSAESWDCHVNHYRNYEWEDLGEAQANHAALGWTEDMWCGDGEPKEEGKYWEDLTEAQRQAAARVCYTREIWDEVAIPLWGQDDGAGGVLGRKDVADLYSTQETQVAAEKALIYEQMYDPEDQGDAAFEGPASAHNDRGIEVPLFRYDPWELLDASVQATAERADYDEKSWNAIGTNPLEEMDWETIGEDHLAMQNVLSSLGFSEMQWDCYITHYHTYTWGELKEAGVQKYYKIMGYSHNSWEQDLYPEVDGMYWPKLTQAQQDAAYQVGYFREAWDEVSLQFWPRTTSNTASLKAYVQQHKAAAAAVGGGTTALVIGLIVACACFYRMATKKNTTVKEYEMQSGDRFADYSDVATGARSDEEDYDEDYPSGDARSRANRSLGSGKDGAEPIV